MSNIKQKHKDYLIKNEIKDLTDLVNYVEILKTTSNLKGEDRQMLFDFAFLITNEQLSLKSFFAENKNKMGCSPTPSKEFYNAFKQSTSSPTFMDEVLEQENKEKWAEINTRDTEEVSKKILHSFIPQKEIEGCMKNGYLADGIGQFNSTRHKSKEGETHTEVPIFNVIDVKQILPKHILDVLEEQEGKRPDTFSYRPNQEIGKKETENKINYEELDWDYIDDMSLRMSKNLNKYPSKNWQKKMDIKKLAEASIRHARKIIQEIENDEESLQEHAIALGCNGMMINYQLKR